MTQLKHRIDLLLARRENPQQPLAARPPDTPPPETERPRERHTPSVAITPTHQHSDSQTHTPLASGPQVSRQPLAAISDDLRAPLEAAYSQLQATLAAARLTLAARREHYDLTHREVVGGYQLVGVDYPEGRIVRSRVSSTPHACPLAVGDRTYVRCEVEGDRLVSVAWPHAYWLRERLARVAVLHDVVITHVCASAADDYWPRPPRTRPAARYALIASGLDGTCVTSLWSEHPIPCVLRVGESARAETVTLTLQYEGAEIRSEWRISEWRYELEPTPVEQREQPRWSWPTHSADAACAAE